MQQLRDNLRQMWKRLTTSARDTTESASAYIERQRKLAALRSEVRKAEGDRGALYAQMGRKVYALHLKQKVANRDLLRSCQQIDELNTLIEAKKTQIEALLSIPDDEEVELEDDTELGEGTEDAEAQDEAEKPEEPAEEKEEDEGDKEPDDEAKAARE